MSRGTILSEELGSLNPAGLLMNVCWWVLLLDYTYLCFSFLRCFLLMLALKLYCLLSFFMPNIRCIIHVCERRRLKGMASFYIILLYWSLKETFSQCYYLLIIRCDYLQVRSVKAWKMISQSQVFREQIFDFLHCALYLHWARISFATLQLNEVASWKCLKLTSAKVKFQKFYQRAKS